MGGQHSESETEQRPVPKTGRELALEDVQLDFARKMLSEFQQQREFQALQRGVVPAAISEMGGVSDPLSALSQDERAAAVRENYRQALAGSRRAAEISDLELDRIRRGGAASPEQIATIRAAADAELESGLRDISRYASAQREAVGTELAPRLGLHRADTPILDRGHRIAAEAVNAAGRLASDVRGREAQARLSYPLAANQATSAAAQPQQALGWSRSDVLAQLNQQAFQNRLALTGQVGQQGLGLATGYNVPAAQQSLKPVIMGEGESSSWGWQGPSCSRALKKVTSTPDGAEILEGLVNLPVAFWHYLADEDKHEHVGTFAEDMRDTFGIGDGKTIDLRDLAGLLLVGLQTVAKQVEGLCAEETA
jgi:hypothetical protein